MTLRSPRRGNAFGRVFVFVARQWRLRSGLVSALLSATVTAALADVFLPLYAGRLVDALGAGDRSVALATALWAFAAMAGLGLIGIVARHLG